jgi:quinol monooxygenase YgiN
MFVSHRAVDDPAVFFLYEQYTDAAGFEAHRATPHFEEFVRGRALPNLASRELALYETID